MQLEQIDALALADRAAGFVDDEGHPVTPEGYRQRWLAWLNHDPERTEDAQVARLMRELEVA